MRSVFLAATLLLVVGCNDVYSGPERYECADATAAERSEMIKTCLTGVEESVDPCNRPNPEDVIQKCEGLSVRIHCEKIRTYFYAQHATSAPANRGPILDCSTASSYSEEKVCGTYRPLQ